MEELLNNFNKQLEERNEMLRDHQEFSETLSNLSKNPSVQAYILLKKRIEQLKSEIDVTTDDLMDYILNNTYGLNESGPYVWMYDFYYTPSKMAIPEEQRSKITVTKDHPNSSYRVYKNIESANEKVVAKADIDYFEQENEIIVYNPKNQNGISERQFQKIREKYFDNLLDDKQKSKKRTK